MPIRASEGLVQHRDGRKRAGVKLLRGKKVEKASRPLTGVAGTISGGRVFPAGSTLFLFSSESVLRTDPSGSRRARPSPPPLSAALPPAGRRQPRRLRGGGGAASPAALLYAKIQPAEAAGNSSQLLPIGGRSHTLPASLRGAQAGGGGGEEAGPGGQWLGADRRLPRPRGRPLGRAPGVSGPPPLPVAVDNFTAGWGGGRGLRTQLGRARAQEKEPQGPRQSWALAGPQPRCASSPAPQDRRWRRGTGHGHLPRPHPHPTPSPA